MFNLYEDPTTSVLRSSSVVTEGFFYHQNNEEFPFSVPNFTQCYLSEYPALTHPPMPPKEDEDGP
jgi:hypothetical protein